jgi:hypothetical protein
MVRNIEVTIRPHPKYGETHSLVIVETRTRAYSTTWADTPTESDVRQAWKYDRAAFLPYFGS